MYEDKPPFSLARQSRQDGGFELRIKVSNYWIKAVCNG